MRRGTKTSVAVGASWVKASSLSCALNAFFLAFKWDFESYQPDIRRTLQQVLYAFNRGHIALLISTSYQRLTHISSFNTHRSCPSHHSHCQACNGWGFVCLLVLWSAWRKKLGLGPAQSQLLLIVENIGILAKPCPERLKKKNVLILYLLYVHKWSSEDTFRKVRCSLHHVCFRDRTPAGRLDSRQVSHFAFSPVQGFILFIG